MDRVTSKSVFRILREPGGLVDINRQMFTGKCVLNGIALLASVLLLMSAFLLSGRIDRIQAELDALQGFEASRTETVLRLFEFDSLLEQEMKQPSPDRRSEITRAFETYRTSLANLSQLRLFAGHEDFLEQVRRYSDDFDAASPDGSPHDALNIEALVAVFTELGGYNASLISERTAYQENIRKTNYVLVGSAGFIALCVGLMMLVCFRKRLIKSRLDQEMLIASNHSLNAEITRKAADLNRVETLFNASLGASSVTMFMQNRDLVYSWIHGTIPNYLNPEDVGRSDFELPPCPFQDLLIEAKRDVMARGKAASFECSPNEGSPNLTYWINIDPLIQDGKIIGVIGVMKDISARLRREADTHALLQELVHRAQNLLGVVLSMARLSARSSSSIDEFSDKFSARIAAMARSFDVLVDHDWHGAPIHTLIHASLTDLDERLKDRVHLSGPDVQLNPLVAQNFAMAIHELIKNAVDHGALRDGKGRVALSWMINEHDLARPEFYCKWTEISDDPKLLRENMSGFGRVVLETIVPRALGGVGRLSNDAQGVSWTLSCPLKADEIDSDLATPMSAALAALENAVHHERAEIRKAEFTRVN